MVVSELVAATEALGAENAQLVGRLLEAARELCAREAALEADTSRLHADRRQLEEDRQRFQAECESVRQLGVQASDVIVLDVGGRHFHTTRRTLCAVPGSMLAAWFSGRHTIQTRPDGTVFVDRSPLLFDYVLDYLRTGGDQPLLPPDENAKERLRDEFLFYGLPWFEADKPSVLDFFGGDIRSVTLSHKFESAATHIHIGTERLLTTNIDLGDTEPSAILWDRVTGRKIYTWPGEDMQHGKLVQPLTLNGNPFSSQVILGVYRKDDGVVTTVVYSCQDGSVIRKQVLEGADESVRCLVANGDTLIAIVQDKRLSAWSIETEALLWERMIDESNGPLCPCLNYSHEAFVYLDKDVFVVCDLADGKELYRASDNYRSRADYWLTGKQLSTINGADDGDGVIYQSWDEKGHVLVPPTRLACEGSVDCFCDGNMFVTITDLGLRTYPLTFSAPQSVAVREGMEIRLGDGAWWEDLDTVYVGVDAVATLGGDGVVTIFTVHKEKSRKRRRVD